MMQQRGKKTNKDGCAQTGREKMTPIKRVMEEERKK